MKLIYISQGNIPSLYAHTIQCMKMVEAFTSFFSEVTLVTSGALLKRKNPININALYGVGNSFKIVKLPLFLKLPDILEGGNHPRFEKWAGIYAKLRAPTLVYTRSPKIAKNCVTAGLDTIAETHIENDTNAFKHLLEISEDPHLLGVVTITDYIGHQYVDAGIPASKMFVWPDAVNLDQFDHRLKKASIRKKLGLPEDTVIATYCGHLYQDRGIEQIFEAAAMLPQIQFLMVGGWENDIQNRKKQARGLSNIHIAGFIHNAMVPDYLMASDVLLMPYSEKCESAKWMSPLKLFEYMAARRPIIATEIPALKKILGHRTNSYLVKPDSAEAIVSGIKALIEDRRLADQISENAWEAVKNYTWKNRVADILKTFGITPDPLQAALS